MTTTRSRPRYRTKAGEHGTLYLYRVPYRCSADHHHTGADRYWAYDAEHAADLFHCGDGPVLGFEINGEPTRVRDRG